MRTWLFQRRLELQLTQEEVAEQADIARTTYASIEQGLRNPSVNVAKKLAAVLQLDWTIFFEERCHETCS